MRSSQRKWLILSHTHWDREWYLPFQELRLKLVELMDRLQEILAGDPTYRHFMLDGQSIVVEDYLEFAPWAKNTVTNLVREGRLSIGPWYVLPDEFLVSGEALIRNLLAGIQTAEGYGGSMRVGYLPDQFGHIAQMPQILAGFGIDTAVVWRGVGKEINGSEFLWQALDGTEVFSLYLPKGYFNLPILPRDSEALTAQLASLGQCLVPFASTEYLVVMNGCDHGYPQDYTGKVIAAANEESGEKVVEQVDLKRITELLRRSIGDELLTLPSFRGELCDSQRTHLLPGVLSSRMWIKQRNNACERLLEEWAEPFAAWQEWLESRGTEPSAKEGSKTIKPTPSNTRQARRGLKLAWRQLLQNQPHDSVCGCSIDSVHEEMKTRYAAVEQIASSIARDALEGIASQVNTGEAIARLKAAAAPVATGAASPDPVPIIVFNAADGLRSDFVSLRVHLEPWDEVSITDEVGQAVVVQRLTEPPEDILSGGLDRIALTDALDALRTGQPAHPGKQIVTLGFIAEAVPGRGYRTYFLLFGADAALPAAPVEQSRIRNEFYTVEVDRLDGTLVIGEVSTGRRWAGLNRFVDGGDAGDEYNYDAPFHDQVVDRPASEPEIAVLESGPVRSILRVHLVLSLPITVTTDRRNRSGELVECAIDTYVTLYKGVPRVEIRTEVENHALDHRLRVHFPTGLLSAKVHREVHFGVVPFPPVSAEVDETWVERPVSTRPQKRFVHASDGKNGLLLTNRGLPEVEVIETTAGAELALTLLRCVGWLSRDDLRSRRGHAGPELPVPGAQCLGRQVFEYALVPGSTAWANTAKQASWFNAPLHAVVGRANAGHLPLKTALIESEPESVVISTIKPPENGDGLIVRFFNPTDQTQQCRIRPGINYSRVRRINLEESELEAGALIDDHHTVQLPVSPYQIVTLRFDP